MEGRRDRRVPFTVLMAFMIVTADFATAVAEEPAWRPRPTVVVTTNDDSAVVEASMRYGGGGEPGRGSGSGGGRSRGRRRAGSSNDRGCSAAMELTPQNGPDQGSYVAYSCQEGGGFFRRRRPQGPGPSGPASNDEVAMHMRDEMPMPSVTVRINPDRGLVGTESWFWVEGYDGRPISQSSDAFGGNVEVEARPTGYEWFFGDGSSLWTTSPGRPYPHRSDVRHMFQRSSAGKAAGYSVKVRFIFAVRYRVDGGQWTDLPPISRVAGARYLVRESQAVISR